MGGVFGSTDKPSQTNTRAQITEKDKAILALKNNRDRLKKYLKALAIESKSLGDQARELVHSGKKERAILILKIRKLKESRAEEIDGQLLTLYNTIEKIETASLNVEILKSIESGTKVLNELHSQYPLDKVQQLMEDTEEAIEMEGQINSILSGTRFSAAEDRELEEELDRLTGVVPVSSLPIAPTDVPVIFSEAPTAAVVITQAETRMKRSTATS